MKARTIVLAFFLLFISSAHAKVFHFIYIEAGEGNSSGGHVAVQFGEDVYHYQYDNTLIRLFKQNAGHFRAYYQLLQNRSLHIADIEVSDAAYDQLSSYFKVRFLAQKQNLKYLHALQQDQALLQALLKMKTGKPSNLPDEPELSLRLLGAGLFYTDENSVPKGNTEVECDTVHSGATVISEVRQQLEIRYGKSYLPQQINKVRDRLNQLSPLTDSDDAFFGYPFSERYSDLLNGLLALQVLQKYQPLATDACFQVNLPEIQLTDPQIHQAKAYQQQLLRSVLPLMASNRPDWGYALFITLARMITIEQSTQARHWIFLDDTDETAVPITNNQIAIYAKQMQQERREDIKRFHETVADLKAYPTAYDRYYAEAEMAANRYHQWQRSDKAQSLCYQSEQALPEKSISIKHFLLSGLPVKDIRLALQHQAKASNKLAGEDYNRNTYHLLTNNCVSAMFRLINDATSGQSVQMLGGFIDPKFNFIPFQAFESVQDSYKVVNTKKLSAYREQNLALMYEHETAGVVYLRESNIFSSSLYNYNPDDAWFVFFTDDAVFLRPLFGAVNTFASASQSVLGLITWPFDQGKALKVGARGVLASLPELAFFNIRKGSYPYPIQQ